MSKIKYLTLILLFICCADCLAQKVPAWGGGSDLKDLGFGFTFSYIGSYYKIDKALDWQTPFIDPVNNTPVTNTLNSISSSYASGFGVGFLTRYRLTEHLEARVAPSLIFADRVVKYTYVNQDPINKLVTSTAVDFPLSLKLKSDRMDNLRVYLMGGVKLTQAISSKYNSDVDLPPIDKIVKNVNRYGSYEVGLGCEIYFEFFKLSPEIKISNSFGNVMLHDNSAFSKPISNLGLHTVMFSLYFE
ncbi:hypothetical protein GCM10027049_08060 [Mucilaginibacter puniceus]